MIMQPSASIILLHKQHLSSAGLMDRTDGKHKHITYEELCNAVRPVLDYCKSPQWTSIALIGTIYENPVENSMLILIIYMLSMIVRGTGVNGLSANRSRSHGIEASKN